MAREMQFRVMEPGDPVVLPHGSLVTRVTSTETMTSLVETGVIHRTPTFHVDARPAISIAQRAYRWSVKAGAWIHVGARVSDAVAVMKASGGA